MKKVYFTSLVLGAMLVSANAFAVDSTGCGLGSMAWRGQKGIGPAGFGGNDQRIIFKSDFRHHFRYFRLRSGGTGYRRNAENGVGLY